MTAYADKASSSYSLRAGETVGLFGGTFDPPTVAHLVAAEYVRDQLGLDRVLFVLNRINPHKVDKEVTPPQIRLTMLRKALARFPDFYDDTSELTRAGPSYTVDTLRYFLAEYPDVTFTLLIGMDALNSLHLWRDPEKILEMVKVAAFNRGDISITAEGSLWLNRITLLEVPRMDLSSTLVRARVEQGHAYNSLVPFGVGDIIHREKLYRR